jgi:hypothetical protein
MKLYIASILALSDLQIAGEVGMPGTLTNAIPALIPAASIDAAAERARVMAFRRWLPEEGWHTHQANIMNVTKAFYDAFIEAQQAGILDMSDEEPITFNFEELDRQTQKAKPK